MILPTLPGRAEEPTFAEPWQAKAFATTVALSRAGLFTWPEWAAALGAEIARQPQRPREACADADYRQWLAALEMLLAARGIASVADIDATAEHWRRSYQHTSHGKSVTLRRDLDTAKTGSDEHEHGHDRCARPGPVAVSKAGPAQPPGRM